MEGGHWSVMSSGTLSLPYGITQCYEMPALVDVTRHDDGVVLRLEAAQVNLQCLHSRNT